MGRRATRSRPYDRLTWRGVHVHYLAGVRSDHPALGHRWWSIQCLIVRPAVGRWLAAVVLSPAGCSVSPPAGVAGVVRRTTAVAARRAAVAGVIGRTTVRRTLPPRSTPTCANNAGRPTAGPCPQLAAMQNSRALSPARRIAPSASTRGSGWRTSRSRTSSETRRTGSSSEAGRAHVMSMCT